MTGSPGSSDQPTVKYRLSFVYKQKIFATLLRNQASQHATNTYLKRFSYDPRGRSLYEHERCLLRIVIDALLDHLSPPCEQRQFTTTNGQLSGAIYTNGKSFTLPFSSKPQEINMMNIRFGDLFRSLMTDTLE